MKTKHLPARRQTAVCEFVLGIHLFERHQRRRLLDVMGANVAIAIFDPFHGTSVRKRNIHLRCCWGVRRSDDGNSQIRVTGAINTTLPLPTRSLYFHGNTCLKICVVGAWKWLQVLERTGKIWTACHSGATAKKGQIASHSFLVTHASSRPIFWYRYVIQFSSGTTLL